MCDISEAIAYLDDNDVSAFDCNNILIVPCGKPEDIYDMASKVKRLLKECGYEKSWSIDPYYFQRHNALAESMFGTADNSSSKM